MLKVLRFGLLIFGGLVLTGFAYSDVTLPQARFTYEDVVGIGKEDGVCRRDPSDIIKVDDTYYIWYSRVEQGAPIYPSGYYATVWYAVSKDEGRTWTEKGEAVGKGPSGSFDSYAVFTPNILPYKGKYYLYYTAVADGFDNKSYSEINKTKIGVAVADSPDGPWAKPKNNIMIQPSMDQTKFDSFRCDDACFIVRDDKIYFYYKGRAWQKTPGQTKMGVAVADDPLGPFTKLNDGKFVQDSGHEVMVWPYAGGVMSLASNTGPNGRSLFWAQDCVNFNVVQRDLKKLPNAPGCFRTDLSGQPKDDKGIAWGISMIHGRHPYLVHYECNLRDVSDNDRGIAWPFLKSYSGDNLAEISMPLGGLGTGTVGLGGRGDLRDWEIVNRGAMGYRPAFSAGPLNLAVAPFFAVYAKDADGKSHARLAEGPIEARKAIGDWGSNEYNSGFPRFGQAAFNGAYPIAQVDFTDDEVPVDVSLQAFNPLIPGDSERSGIPVAVLRYVVKNKTNQPLTAAVCGMVPNFIGADGWTGAAKKNRNTWRNKDGIAGIFMDSEGVDKKDINWGTMALTTFAKDNIELSYKTDWVRKDWNGEVIDFWDDFSEDGTLDNYVGKSPDFPPRGTVCANVRVPARQSKVVTFMLTWHFPNRIGWDGQPGWKQENIGNYYTTRFKDAWDVADYVRDNYTSLKNDTLAFVKAFVDADVPASIKEAALFNLCHLRSQTLFRDKDGFPFGWEGSGSLAGTPLNVKAGRNGWGPGTCTHVWNYDVTTPFVFGDIAMLMRDVEFKYCTDKKTGLMHHRFQLPLKTTKQTVGAAADGQLGCIMKIYREWQLSGDNAKLSELWPDVKRAMEFVWGNSNWDPQPDGILEGSHHNTMDINYYGPDPEIGSWYLGALRACEIMAMQMDDKPLAEKCANLYRNGSDYIDRELFNGEYYAQQIVPGHERYQIGEGILIDQLVGQYMAYVIGLGELLDADNIRTALKTIREKNWVDSFHTNFSSFRAYAFGKGEAGLVNAYYPPGKRLKYPFPYYSEVWTGFEYSVAAQMIYAGLEQEGLDVVQAARNRHDGKARNPFNEGEFGHRYARAMSSWAPLLAWMGFQYSAVDQTVEFADRQGTFFWSTGYGYGTVTISGDGNNRQVTFSVLSGKDIQLKNLTIKGVGDLNFDRLVTVKAGQSKTVIISKTM